MGKGVETVITTRTKESKDHLNHIMVSQITELEGTIQCLKQWSPEIKF